MSGHVHNTDDGSCPCRPVVSSVTQTLQEMDWERGIWAAALENDLDRLERRLAGGVHPDTQDTGGYTALHYAAGAGHIQAAELLLRAGASPHVQTPGGATPLHRAATRGHMKMFARLLNAGACTDTVDTDGSTVLHRAAVADHIAICRRLIELNPALTDKRNNRGQRPLDLCRSDELKLILS